MSGICSKHQGHDPACEICCAIDPGPFIKAWCDSGMDGDPRGMMVREEVYAGGIELWNAALLAVATHPKVKGLGGRQYRTVMAVLEELKEED